MICHSERSEEPKRKEEKMAYTAYAKMREVNRERFGKDLGPFEPKLFSSREHPNGLKAAALRFLHNRCEGLRFDEKTESEFEGAPFTGRSIGAAQVPYNMQMDTDRLCLERELQNFIDTGTAEYAYTVYYCFLEMFVGKYGASHSMIELLSEFESNASSLLMKHRDHYSHSVYVFALGLAIYETNEEYRRIFREFYKKMIPFRRDDTEEVKEALTACFFLEYWGLASLFHDIGYPFEIPFEQVMAYFEVNKKDRGKGTIYLAYHDVEALTALSKKAKSRFKRIYDRDFVSTDELLAFDITEKLGEAYGFDYEYMLSKIKNKPGLPNKNGYFMDHAYFSAARLCGELFETIGKDRGVNKITRAHVDVLSAIMLHNSLFKFAISFFKETEDKRKPELKAELHPIAYMLMICDELQCWDRTAYGRNSRTELHPMAADFDFSDGCIDAVYYYDAEEQQKITDFRIEYGKWEKKVKKEGPEKAGKAPRLKAYSDMNEKEQVFTTEIEHIVDTSIMPLTVVPSIRPANRSAKHTYLSDSNFLHLYDFAVSLNGRYSHQGEEAEVKTEQLEKEFDVMSLEYKLSNIHQARSFDRFLNVIGCFYTDKPVDFDMLNRFSREELDTIAPMEHERWVREHISMAWMAGNEYECVGLTDEEAKKMKCEPVPLTEDEKAELSSGNTTLKAIRAGYREQLRRHKLCMNGAVTSAEIHAHYDELPESEQGKDWKPMESMLKLVKKYDGLRIYRLGWTPVKDKK